MSQKVRILYSGVASENVDRLRTLAECLGLAAELVNIRAAGGLSAAVGELGSEGLGGVVLDVESLKRQATQDEWLRIRDLLDEKAVTVLFLVTAAEGAPSCAFIRTLTDGVVDGVKLVSSARRVGFPAEGRVSTAELAGHAYERDAGEGLTLRLRREAEATVLMELDGAPAFVRLPGERARMYVWSTPRVFDMQRPLEEERQFENACDEYIPGMIFLRAAFREQCWHNPAPGAGIVIDDPLLQPRYGLIDFRGLLSSARNHGYHVTLAFIPWNQWRTRRRNIGLFRDYSDCFGICAHGCDHTDNEFGSTDYDALLGKNFLARGRMERHRDRTGLDFSPLMVCPQERYSLEAIRAFSNSRQFLALVCTACMPRNLNRPGLCGGDLLLPAQDSFFGFPVFKRHYWKSMSVFAMALFLGKPAILVEHHEFFRNGAAGAEAFARRLAQLRPGLKWMSLGDAVIRTHWRRVRSDGTQEVRFFTDIFRLDHQAEEPTTYRFLRRIPETTRVDRVLVGGIEVPSSREDGYVAFELRASRPQSISVQVDVPAVKPARVYSPGIGYRAAVAIRRGVSEFRDNVVARNPLALKASRFVVKSVKERARSSRRTAV